MTPSCPDWRRSRSERIRDGCIRSRHSDFQVCELLGFEFSGDGEHDVLQIQKSGANTAWVAGRLADFAGVSERDIGFCGMKDRHAVTRQWFSVRRPAGPKATWSQLEIEGVQVLEQDRHQRKLKRGAHTANQFDILVRDVGELDDDQRNFLDNIVATGVPNYFGEQRFGRNDNNLALASRLFSGRRLSRSQRGIALSAARSFLFNHVLQHRVENESWNTLVAGDVASLQGSNSVFSVPQLDDELIRRCLEQDIHPTGPLWGKGLPATIGDIADLERRVVHEFPDLCDGLERFAKQARRPLRLQVGQFAWSLEGDALRLGFELARGGFATAVLREIVDYKVADRL